MEIRLLQRFVYLCTLALCACAAPPHILLLMADDMGWNDVSFHGSDQILTPNIDALAYSGVVLQHYYSETVCTPARTALLTGKYPMRLGMHGYPLYNSEDRGIPLSERLLPQYLQPLGYSTHLVGKWHVGMSRREMLPTRRGYQTHYGMRGGFVDYLTYNKVENWPDGRELFGLDLFDGDVPQTNERRHAVDALTQRALHIIADHDVKRPLFLHLAHVAPHAGNNGAALQPPPEVNRSRNQHIAHSDRRLYADLVSALDDSVGRVVRALSDRGMLNDTLIIFASDNGAPTTGEFRNWGVNLPLRGKKGGVWDGGARVPALVWHRALQPKIYNGLMHVTDWLPTLLAAAGSAASPLDIDGVDQWAALQMKGARSPRQDVLVAANDAGFAAYRAGGYKLVVGNVSAMDNSYSGTELLALRRPTPPYLPALTASDAARALRRLGHGAALAPDRVMATRLRTTLSQRDPVSDAISCEPTPSRGCLYDVRRDPAERHDVWSTAGAAAAVLTARLQALWAQRQPRSPTALQAEADPALFNYVWTPWNPDTGGIPSKNSSKLRGDNELAESSDYVADAPLEPLPAFIDPLVGDRPAKVTLQPPTGAVLQPSPPCDVCEPTFPFPVLCGTTNNDAQNFLCMLRSVLYSK